MHPLNQGNFPGHRYPDKIIQFGEGNFFRAFVDEPLDLLNEYTVLDADIGLIDTVFPSSLNTQDGLYTPTIRGLNGQEEAVSDSRIIRSVKRELNVYREFDGFLAQATLSSSSC